MHKMRLEKHAQVHVDAHSHAQNETRERQRSRFFCVFFSNQSCEINISDLVYI